VHDFAVLEKQVWGYTFYMDVDGVRPPQSGDEPKKPEFEDPGRIGRLKEQMYSRATQPANRPRRPLSSFSSKTPDDWGETPIPPRKESLLPRSYSLPSILLIIAALIFVVAGGMAISFLLTGSNIVASDKIDIAINGPRTIDGGQVLELQVAIRNNNNATLELADLVVTYPEGTRMPTDVASVMETQRIPLGSIEPGGTRTGTIRAVLFGRDGERQDIQVALEYRLSGSSALFVAEATHTVLVASGTLKIALTTNKQAVAGQSMDMTVTVTSQAKTVVSDAVLRASFPFGFTVTSTSPETETDGFWTLGDIEPGETRTIRILGQLDGQTGDSRVFRFVAGTRDTTATTLVDVVLAEFERKVEVTRPFLGMSLLYGNEYSAEEFVARTGEAVPIVLRWKNNLDVALTDVVVAATLSGSGFDPFGIDVDKGFYRSIDSVALWDKTTTNGELELVPAGAEGTLFLRLIPRIADDLLSVQDPTVKIELHAAGQRLSEGSVPETIQATVSEEFKIATNPSLAGRALYFENPLGSVGPLPPKVENETTYGIIWEVSNTTNLVRDAKVTATLPPYVRWLGTVSPSVEYVTFNENDGTVTWNIGKLLSDTGVNGSSPRRVVFSIGLVPSTSQVGKSPPLIQNQRLTGLDNFVNEPVEVQVGDLTTQLTETDFADIYGVIVP
tara:strand:- start:20548 stop:22566 length:2019 start_codon:yes stop_codon:yes gene_type:complete